MAEKKNKDVAAVIENEVTEAPVDEIATIDAETEKKDPELKDGIYTEYEVELSNGRKIPISVIAVRKNLPATYGSLMAEGNVPALTIATLTTYTRRLLDLAGATMEDIEEILPAVIQRGRDAAGAAEK